MSDDRQQPERPDPEQVGSVGDEAAKLFAALSGMAKDATASGGNHATGAADGLAGAFRDLNAHVATGGADCRFCPVCQVIHAVRETSPEVKQHLAVAASSLMHAAAGVLATQVPESGARDRGVENIDLNDGDSWGEDE